MQKYTSELSDKLNKAEIIKKVGRIIRRKARYYAPYALLVAAIGGTCGGFAAKVRYDWAHISPELKACYNVCYARYKNDIKKLKEIDEEHNCSSYWWEQSVEEARDSRNMCVSRCYEGEGKKKGSELK